MFHQVSPDNADSVAQLRLPQAPLTEQSNRERFLGGNVIINVACVPLSEICETMRQQFDRDPRRIVSRGGRVRLYKTRSTARRAS